MSFVHNNNTFQEIKNTLELIVKFVEYMNNSNSSESSESESESFESSESESESFESSESESSELSESKSSESSELSESESFKFSESKSSESKSSELSESSNINIFIVWTPSYLDSNPNLNHILGIYKNEDLAIKQCQKYNDYDDFDQSDIIDRSETNIICEDASMINSDSEVYCTKIKIDESTNTLYFLKIFEYGDGGSYHRQMWLSVDEDQQRAIDNAINYFDNEHNRDKECEDCPHCLEEMIQLLKNGESASITCTSYLGANLEMWEMKLT